MWPTVKPKALSVVERAEGKPWGTSSPLKNAGVALRAGLVLNEEDGGEAYQEDTTTVVR